MDKKSKYSLFPSFPSPPPRTSLPPLPQTSSSPQRPRPPSALPRFREPTPPPSPLESEQSLPAQDSPTLPQHWFPYPQGRVEGRSHSPRENIPPTEERTDPYSDTQIGQTMHLATRHPIPSSSSSTSVSSSSSLHKATPHASPLKKLRNRPRTVYIHRGLGGAGNYRKVIREDPYTAQNACRPAPGRPQAPKFLASLFGTLGGRKDKAGAGEKTSLGAAEVMRRKLVGYGSDRKRDSSGSRS